MLDPLIIDLLNILIVTNVLYFSVLFALIFLENKKKMQMDPPEPNVWPFVSIVIPAFNEEDNIEETIEAVKALDYPKNKLEIIVVDDCSTDNTYKIAKSTGVKVLHLEKNSGKKAIPVNRGLVVAKGEYFATVDADSYPQPDALKRAMRYFTHDNVAAVTTTIFAKKSNTIWGRMQRIDYIMVATTRKLMDFFGGIFVLPGPLSVYRRDVLLKVGGFDSKNITEDIEIAWRLLSRGYEIKMSFGSKVTTKVPQNFRSWWRQRVRWGVGGMQTFAKYSYAIAKSEYKMLGLFILPLFVMSYSLTFLAISLTAYVLSNWLYSSTFFTYGSLNAGIGVVDLIQSSQFILNMNALLVLAAVGLTFTFYMFIHLFREADAKLLEKGWYLDIPAYMLFFSLLLPLSVMHSVYKLARGKVSW